MLLLLTCAGIDCSNLSQPWKDLSKGLAGVSLGLSYIFMVIEALFTEKRIFLDDEATTNEEAMDILERKLLEPTPVEWVVECGHVVTRGTKNLNLFLSIIVYFGITSYFHMQLSSDGS